MRHQTVTTRRTEEPWAPPSAEALADALARGDADGTRRARLACALEERDHLAAQLAGAVAAGDALADAVRGLDSYAALGGAPMERTTRADAALRAWAAR